ncbi:hypothetical protein P9A47_gp46 [Xanthomonas phage Elanor]|uniref:Uncharacterized protein n=1 Tax=Xanthomonas phage Elanor TaxID=2939127 RepID=A0A9E7E1X6_9CAUD|nr:hypothetical protein P9A47_gp46 [Xanthomonas phage Elanor]URA07014.1 hypothetical protein Elanor_BL40046 [Xanthomonas phage Elanor]
MFGVSAFCMWTVAYVLYRDLNSGPADTAVTMSFLTLLGIVGSYVFGATWEDVSLAKIKGPAGAKSARLTKPAPGPGASADMEDVS